MTMLEHHRIPDTIAMDTRHLQELGKTLQRYCLSLTRSRFDADDLAQETWAKALGYCKFTISPNPEALLLRIAKNTWIDASRRQGSLIRAMERSGVSSDPASAAAALEELTEMELTFQALLAHLAAAADRLGPPRCAGVFSRRVRRTLGNHGRRGQSCAAPCTPGLEQGPGGADPV